MNRGTWYLMYDWNDTFGGGLAGAWEYKEIPLEASTEDEAIAKAETIWQQKVNEAVAYWKKQKREWEHPPESPFRDGPTNPRVIYKISLQ
jgi:hypothetical protein